MMTLNHGHTGLMHTGQRLVKMSLLVLAAALPFNTLLTQVSVITLAAGWLLEGGWQQKWQRLKNPFLLIVLLFPLWHVLGVLWSDNLSQAIFELEKKTTLFVIPIFLGTSNIPWSDKERDLCLRVFSFSSVLVALSLLGVATFKYIETQHSGVFFNIEFAAPLNLHHVYLSVYFALSASYLLAVSGVSTTGRFNLIYFVSAAVLLLCIMLLAARTTLLFLGFTALVVIIRNLFRPGRKTFRIILFTALLVLGITAVSRINLINERFQSVFSSDLSRPPDGDNANGLTVRLAKWKCSLALIRKHPAGGVGTGMSQEALNTCYQEINFWGWRYNYNSHNQFLQTGVTLGMPGLLILLAIFLAALRRLIIRHDTLGLFFIFLMAFTFLTESFLERQLGIIFFIFFLMIFTKSHYKFSE